MRLWTSPLRLLKYLGHLENWITYIPCFPQEGSWRIRHIINQANVCTNMNVLLKEDKCNQRWSQTVPGITNSPVVVMAYGQWSYHRRLRHMTYHHLKKLVSSVVLSLLTTVENGEGSCSFLGNGNNDYSFQVRNWPQTKEIILPNVDNWVTKQQQQNKNTWTRLKTPNVASLGLCMSCRQLSWSFFFP